MYRGMRLEVLAPSKVAILPLVAACTDSLKQFQEVVPDYTRFHNCAARLSLQEICTSHSSLPTFCDIDAYQTQY